MDTVHESLEVSIVFAVSKLLLNHVCDSYSDPEKKVEVFDEDDAVLAQLGYTQGMRS